MNIGIIGLGVMGTNHVRVASRFRNNLYVSDIDSEKVKLVSSSFKVAGAYTDHIEMISNQKLDGVIIAVPSQFHYNIAMDCISRGLNVLVEKPVAENIGDAKKMINFAAKKNVIFTVGHVERHNPAVAKLKELVKKGKLGEIYLVKTVRAGPFPKRLYGSPGGVLADLAVHDVDVVHYLLGPFKRLTSQQIVEGRQDLYSKVMFTLRNRVKGSLEFSWVSPRRVREIELYGTKGMVRCNYYEQSIEFFDNSKYDHFKSKDFLRGRISAGKIKNIKVNKKEPLMVEHEDFYNAIKCKKKPLVSGVEGLDALQIVNAIISSGKLRKDIVL